MILCSFNTTFHFRKAKKRPRCQRGRIGSDKQE